jgi:CheY-like chemotaxis protein
MATEWRALYIDDDPEYLQQVSEALSGAKVLEPDHTLSIKTIEDFDDAIPELENKRYDLVIIDLRLGDTLIEVAEEEGIKILESIQSRIFLPIIFFTVLPLKLAGLSSQLIRIVDKKDGPDKLLEEIMDIFKTKLPIVNRALIRHVQDIQRYYMWEFVANNWEAFGDTPDRTSLAYFLARRLAKSLDSPGIQELAERLGDSTKIMCSEDNVHPMRYYVMPPVGAEPVSGDIVKEEGGGQTKYMVLITPTCDFVHKRVDLMLFARCSLLRDRQEFIDWKDNPEDPKGEYKGKLVRLLRNGASERFFFLPGVFDLPDLVVDYQQLNIIEKPQFDKLKGEGGFKCVASLDGPFSEALLARFARYFGRLGTPDLNIDLILERIKGEKKS